ncbi:hypothetical protein F4818DRAFT_252410 [Hypoxylon cercidicola]|nr:hypothetical protein F4818DRAFT_252410 [Hypoxylon cercidicola]
MAPPFYDYTNFKSAIFDEGALTCCDFCDRDDAQLRCNGCHEALYCSENCRTQDRPQHEMLCASAKDYFDNSKRPPNHIRGIIFHLDSKAPSFVWLNKECWPLSVAQAFDMDVKNLLPPNDNRFGIVHRKLAHGILEYHGRNSTRPELQRFNRSIAALSRPGLLPFYYCNFLYCGFVANHSDNTIIPQDASMKDFRAVTDFVQNSASDFVIANDSRFPGKWLSKNSDHEYRMRVATKISCEADIQRLSSMREAKTWPLVEDVFTVHCSQSDAGSPLFLAGLAGLPWEFKASSAAHLADDGKRNYAGRIFAASTITDEKGERVWSTKPNSGTLYIFNSNSAPIHPDHVLAFYDFAESQLKQISEHQCSVRLSLSPGREQARVSLDELKKWFTRKRFEAYWGQWCFQRERSCTYGHDYRGLVRGPVFSPQPPWHPYAFVEKELDRASSDSTFEDLRQILLRLSNSFKW